MVVHDCESPVTLTSIPNTAHFDLKNDDIGGKKSFFRIDSFYIPDR